ncbi:MAG: polyhydroxyalkanoate biosynthesis repressor PhaR [Acidobacteria bacterium RIFCSPLOWO2_12_FULL_67_14b]|nr:MAG: polyhydroxyalkanoate biosynthesis repressor PhaR [Acidobacteria bacterium RIFCSPLOWO2_12_FULL_67_14b]
MLPELSIGGRRVGPAHVPLVIAEIGINHEGSLDVARQIVDAAKRAGVEVVKHQTHVVDDEMSGAAKKVVPGNADVSIYQIMERCALSENDERRLKDYVESKGMIFMSTPFSRAAADRLERMNVPAYKIGSGECNNYPLLKHIASFGKPIILSTGMNTIESVGKAVAIFEQQGVPHALLHTTNLYPTPPHLVRLGAMVELGKAFPKAVIGLSDHTTDNLACLGAVALGASIVERHFIDTMSRVGPDIVCSMDEARCRELIQSAKILHAEIGGTKGPVKEEQVTMDFAFATVVTITPIKAGEALTKNNLWVKRPGTGSIPAERYDELLGKKARRDLPADTHLSLDDVE